MKLPEPTLPYIKGEKFGELIRMKIEQEEEVKDRMEVVENLVTGKKVIHVGCLDHVPLIEEKIKSDRWFHGRLSRLASECIGIDINQEGIELVKEKFKITNIVYGNLEHDQPLEAILSQQWDYIVFGEILEHVDNPVNFLSSLVAKYKNKINQIILTVPNAFRVGNIISSFQNIELINSDHRYWFSPYTLWKIVEQSGLKLEKMYMCKFSTNAGWKRKIKKILLKKYPLMAEDIVVICSLPK